MFNVEKLIQVCGYILKKYDGRLNYTKLIKLLYLADKEALKESLITISDDEYVCMTNGPVLISLYDLIRNRYSNNDDINAQSLWNARFIKDGYDLVYISPQYPEGKMSEYDKDVIDRIDAQYHDKSHGELINAVHRREICPEWTDPGHGTTSPLHLEKILKSIGCSDKEILWFLEEKEIYEEEDRHFDKIAELIVSK
ncbi:MAG: SocA family protein [Synergistaceae bacterium]|nr:SocA family protein [Synergistaceae bacterium]